MIHVNVNTIINRPVEDLFAFVANLENHPKREMNFEAVKLLTSTATGVGPTYECKLTLPGQSATSKFEITEYEANKKIAFKGEAAGSAAPNIAFIK